MKSPPINGYEPCRQELTIVKNRSRTFISKYFYGDEYTGRRSDLIPRHLRRRLAVQINRAESYDEPDVSKDYRGLI
jgi:hypothetical protein